MAEPHHTARHYVPEHGVAYYSEPVDLVSYHETPAHRVYDAYQHDYDTERQPVISYGHHDDGKFHKEYHQACRAKHYCDSFAKFIARDAYEYTSANPEV